MCAPVVPVSKVLYVWLYVGMVVMCVIRNTDRRHSVRVETGVASKFGCRRWLKDPP